MLLLCAGCFACGGFGVTLLWFWVCHVWCACLMVTVSSWLAIGAFYLLVFACVLLDFPLWLVYACLV